ERSGGRRKLAWFDQRAQRTRDVQERVLAYDWVVAFEHVLVEGVPDPAEFVGIVLRERKPESVTVPIGEADAPTVLDRLKVGIGPGSWDEAARTGKAERRVEESPGRLCREGKVRRR